SHYGYGRGYYSKAGARRSPLNLVTTHFDLSRNANRRRSDRKRSAKNTVNATFSEEPEEREGCDASGRTDIHPANPESQARAPFFFEPLDGNGRSPVFCVSTATSLTNREMSDNEPLRCQRMCRVSRHKFSSSPARP